MKCQNHTWNLLQHKIINLESIIMPNMNIFYRSKLEILWGIYVLFFSSFVCMSFVCMRKSPSKQYTNVYVKSIFIGPTPLRECLGARRFRPTLLLHTTCVRSCCTRRASCVAAFKKKKNHTIIMLNMNNDYKSKLNLLWSICILFYSSFICISAYANVFFTTICKYSVKSKFQMSEILIWRNIQNWCPI